MAAPGPSGEAAELPQAVPERKHATAPPAGDAAVRATAPVSPVLVKAPPVRRRSKLAEMAASAGRTGDAEGLKHNAQTLLEKARIELEREEAEEWESSAERFGDGLFAFFANPRCHRSTTTSGKACDSSRIPGR